MSRIRDFWEKHRLLIIALVIYIIVYILNNAFPAWLEYEKIYSDGLFGTRIERERASGGFLKMYVKDVLPESNVFARLIPLDFFYYGLADIAAAVHYEIYFPLGLVTYVSLLLDAVLKPLCGENMLPPERYVIHYLVGNAVFYPLSFLMILLQKTLGNAEAVYAHFFNDVIGGIPILRLIVGLTFIVVVLALTVYLALPMAVNCAYFFIYLIGLKLPLKFISLCDGWLQGDADTSNILIQFLVFLIAAIVLLLYNLLAEWILEKLQKLSLKPGVLLYHKLSRR